MGLASGGIEVIQQRTFMDVKRRYLNKLYPITKLLYLLLFSILSIIAPSWWYSYFLFIFLVLFAATGDSVKVFMKKIVRSVLFLFILIFALQTLFRPGQDIIFHLWIFAAKWEGVFYALNLCGILLVIASSFILFFQTTQMQDLILSLEASGFSHTASYIILSTLQMIPQTKKRSEIIMNAQQARGIETKGGLKVRLRAFIPMLAPLILSSFSGIEERALTLEARAFSAPCKKTHIRTVEKGRFDGLLRVTAALILLAAVAGRCTIWH
ncbi:energy-coupling factor transporter transmembrane component T [Sediminispirochaeta bajacaliforniensis]|uniref:energy-coupling factor transporter transmembrane component T n=1 Tax=Sediminispirochaeta bajacaliforniensis TaxID=148 RepID=UPI00037D6901|nr:energy-coupling factor transporter transmembrane component T [Sediminispirochaeta bajacaliforniensis]